MSNKASSHATFVRVLPFGIFMAFIGIKGGISWFNEYQVLRVAPVDLLYIYPIKAVVVGITLLCMLRHYEEITCRDFANWRNTMLSVATGLIIFIIWINMDWGLASKGDAAGFNPYLIANKNISAAMIGVRLFGAVLVVPIMEEIFWRSYLLRYVINPQFTTVAIGKLTWGAFVATTVLFGLEHHLIIAGMMAGALLNLLLYQTRSIAQCILSHAVANLALGLYVLQTGQWQFW